MQILLNSVVNIIGGSIWPVYEHKNLRFDDEKDIHMDFKNCEANGYGHDLDLLIILHKWHVLYPTRSGWREKIIHFRHINLGVKLPFITICSSNTA